MNTSIRAQGFFASFVILLAAVLPCAAQNFWQPATGNWDIPTNWSLGTVPTLAPNSSNVAQITDDRTAIIGAGVVGEAYGLAIFTGHLTVENGGTLTTGLGWTIGFTAPHVGSATVTGAGSLWTATGDQAQVGGDGTGTLTLAEGGTLRIGTSGTGTLKLTDPVDAGGAGTLNIGTGGAAGILEAGSVVGGNGAATVNFDHTNSIVFAPQLAGSLAVVKQNSGTTALSGSNSYAGGTTIEAGTLRLESNTALGTGGLDILAGTLDYADGVSIANAISVTPSGSVTPNAWFNVTSGTATQSGTISQATTGIGFAVVKTGTGTLVLTGSNTYTNSTLVREGTLTVDGGTGSNVQVGREDGDQATLRIENGGTVTGSGAEAGFKAGSEGTIYVTGAGSNLTVGGFMQIGGSGQGTLFVEDGASATGGTVLIGFVAGSEGAATVSGSNSVLTANSSGDGIVTVGYSGAGALTVKDGGHVVVRDSGGLWKLRLGFNGGASGILNIGDGGAAGTVEATAVITGSGTGTLNFNHAEAGYYFTDDGTSGGTAVGIQGSTVVNHIGSGTTVLIGANSYTGGTLITDGTLVLTDVGGSASVLGSGTLGVGVGGTLAGNGTVLGNTSVSGTLAPGNSTGNIQFAGDLTLQGDSTVQMELAALGDFDQIGVAGLLTFDGTLSIVLVDDYQPEINDSFQLFDTENPASLTAFDNITFNVGGYAGEMDYPTGTLTITAVPEPATLGLLAGALALLGSRRRK